MGSNGQPPPAPLVVRVLGYLDIALLVVALPIFIGADLPILGWIGGSAAYVAQRLISALLQRSAAQTEDMTSFLGVMVGGVIARGFLVALAIFGVGLIDGPAGAAAGFLFLAAFTVHLTMTLISTPHRKPGGTR
ncbi:MAG TPA: hypothetical protein VGI67_11135 [Thermoleophilaceae bacterium]